MGCGCKGRKKVVVTPPKTNDSESTDNKDVKK